MGHVDQTPQNLALGRAMWDHHVGAMVLVHVRMLADLCKDVW